MNDIRKRTMRCKREITCNLCLFDCRRAEITAKEDEIRSDLLAACEMVLEAAEPCDGEGSVKDGDICEAIDWQAIMAAINKAKTEVKP